MTPRTRSLLTLPLALGLSACDAVEPADELRDGALPQLVLRDVLVSSYQVNGSAVDALHEAGFDLWPGAALDDDGPFLHVTVPGVTLPSDQPTERAVTMRSDGDSARLDLPYKTFSFRVDSDGDAVTTVEYDAPDHDDWIVIDSISWGTSPAEPVESADYVLVTEDGVVTCSAAESFSFNFTKIEDTYGRADVTIDDHCEAHFREALDHSPAEAFFVRCDRTTTSATIGVNVSDITLKRGVINAIGELSLTEA